MPHPLPLFNMYTVEPLNNGHVGDEHFVHCSEVVPLSEVEMYGQLMEGSKQFVHCREVVLYRSVHYRRFYCTCIHIIELYCNGFPLLLFNMYT